MGKLYAVGDIHGCYEELGDLFELIIEDIGDSYYDSKHKIVFFGDYIDRGPDSAKVIQYLQEINSIFSKQIDFVFLKGNHEDMLINAVFDRKSPEDEGMFYYNGGTQTKKSYEDNNLIYKDHETFYKSLERYHRHGDFFFVHAGLAPTDTLDKAINSYVAGYDSLLWAREWNDHDAEFPENVFVIHGHTPVPQVQFNKNQVNIDTGCIYGSERYEEYGQLTAVRLDGRTKEEIKVIQVRRKFK